MKFLNMLIIATTLAASSYANATSIVSDLDDTIKITNVKSKLHFINSLFGRKGFVAMPELYDSVLAHNDGSELYIVSASPKYIGSSVKAFLKKRKYPANRVILKTSEFKNKFEYKVSAITKILSQDNNETYILVGDDTQKDPEVYEAIQQQFSNKVEAVYIRSINGRDLPQGQTRFFSAYDIVLMEHLSGLLDVNDVLRVGRTTLENQKSGLEIPKFAQCPQANWLTNQVDISVLDKQVLSLTKQIEAKIYSACQRRSL